MVHLQQSIDNYARKEGLSPWGAALISAVKSDTLLKRHSFYESWLKKGMHGSMKFLERHLLLRKDPNNIFQNSESILVFAASFAPKGGIGDSDNPKIAGYALRRDYHKVLKTKLKKILKHLKSDNDKVEGRIIVDSAPLDEKGWALQAGLGFIGKNTLLINPDRGSFLLLGEILINKQISHGNPVEKSCGKCVKCIDACPTGALRPYRLNANLCLSYQTIENKQIEKSNNVHHNKRHGWVFGCDLCQVVCPFNRQKGSMSKEAEEGIDPAWQCSLPSGVNWGLLMSLKEHEFNEFFGSTPIHRIGYAKFMDNVTLAYREIINPTNKKFT